MFEENSIRAMNEKVLSLIQERVRESKGGYYDSK